MDGVSDSTHFKTYPKFDDSESLCPKSEKVKFDAKSYRVNKLDEDGSEDEGLGCDLSSVPLLSESSESTLVSCDCSKKLDEIKRSIHARNLQSAFRQFLIAKDRADVNEFGFKRLISSINGQERYYDTAKGMKKFVLIRPIKAPKQLLAGGVKKVQAIDEHFISLEPIQGHFGLLEGRKENRTVRKLLKYPSISPNFIVDHYLSIGINAGDPLFESFIQKGQIVAVNQFEQVTKDLNKMHLEGWLHRDIKSNNMGVCKKTGQIKLFDLSSFVKKSDLEQGKKKNKINVKPFGTKKFTTRELFLRVRDLDAEMLKRQDNYALLIAMMEATDLNVSKIVKRLPQLPSEFGIYHGENRSALDTWINKNVKPEYRENVRKFLFSPSQDSLQNSVYEIIDWS